MSALVAECRTVEIRELEVNATMTKLSGLAVPYNRAADIGWFMEEFAPGSLAKSISEAARSLPLTLFHEDNALDSHIGVASEWRDKAEGLRGVWDLEDNPIAQRAAKLAQPDENGNAVLGYMSIRFAPIRSEWTYARDFNPDMGPDFKDHVRRTEARLLAVSLVSTPAYSSAAVEWVRTAERAITREATGRELDEWSKWLDEVKTR